MILLANLPMRQILNLWLRRYAAVVKQHGHVSLIKDMHLYKLIFYHLMDTLRCSDVEMPCTKHRVVVVHSTTRKMRILSDFDDGESWCGAVTASASLFPCPSSLCDIEWAHGWDTGPYIDGDWACRYRRRQCPGIMSFPIEQRGRAPMNAHIRRKWIKLAYTWLGLLVPQSALYDEGYKDALKHVVPQCVAHIGASRPESQCKSDDICDKVSQLKIFFHELTRRFEDIPPPPSQRLLEYNRTSSRVAFKLLVLLWTAALLHNIMHKTLTRRIAPKMKTVST